MNYIYIVNIVLFVNGVTSVDLTSDQCPWIKGCKCLKSINPWAKGRPIASCFNAVDPALDLLPTINPWSIKIHECRIYNLTLLDHLSKTKAFRIFLVSNQFPGNDGLAFNWQWIPATTTNLSLSNNGFYGFRDGNKTGIDCNITKFKKPLSFSANIEKFAGIPSCLPKTTRWLNLQNLEPMSTKPQEKIKWPSILSILKLSNTGFGNHSRDIFIGAPSTLRVLWIIDENFLNEHWTKGLPFHLINHLIIMQSHLSSLPQEVWEQIGKASKLRALNLAHNEFTDIPSNLPASLITLRMSNNNIRYITARHWSTMTNLRQLDLSSNKLTSVPLNLPATLAELELQSNRIRYSNPEAFIHLKNLIMLNLGNNSLATLPRGIPSGLTYYSVAENRIAHVRDPSEYVFCINCSGFSLNGNPWQCDLKMILMMKWLISHNIGMHTYKTSCQQQDLAGIPSADGRSGITIAIDFMMYFDQAPNDKCSYNLKSLKCQNAGLKEIPNRLPPGLGQIFITDNSKLDSVQDNAFANQQNLYKLSLQNNSLEHFPYGLPNTLKYLDMRNNRIGEWNDRDVKTILNLTSLKDLYLEDNNIRVLYDWQFEGLQKLKWIGLAGNPLHCDCSMESLSAFISNIAGFDRLLVGRNYPTCASPADKKDRDIRGLFGFYRYSDCTPKMCMPMGNTVNCSKAVQTDKRHVFYTEFNFKAGEKVVIHANSYWKTLDLTGLGLKSEQIDYVNLTQLQNIDLSDNLLTQIPVRGLPTSIKVVNLTRNVITNLPAHKEISACLPNIQLLDLRYNKIKIIRSEVNILEVIPRVFLKGNPLECACASRPFINWMHVHKENEDMMHRHRLQGLGCITKDKNVIYQIMEIRENQYCQEFPVAAVVCGVVFGVFFLLLGIFLLNFYAQKGREHRVKEQILLGFEGLLEKERQESNPDPETGIGVNRNYKFDAFVSYDPNSSADAEFVISLLEELEDKRGYTLCLNERDFIPGAGITDNIVECIGESKHIILILSNSFASSPWCQYEVQVSLAELHRRRKSQFIISLLLEDTSYNEESPGNMKNFLSLVSAIEVPRSSQDSEKEWQEFWERLVEMMPQIPHFNINDLTSTP